MLRHCIVHGGSQFSRPVRIDRGVENRLRAFTDLAPLHQPKSLAALQSVGAGIARSGPKPPQYARW